MKYDAIIFDLDGTILDSVPDLVQTMNDILQHYGRDCCDDTIIRENVTFGSAEMLKLAFKDDYPIELTMLREQYLAMYERQNTVKSKLFEGIEIVLAKIESRDIPWAIVTNKYTTLTAPIVAHFGLDSRASAIVCGDTLPVSKPDPSPLLLACKMMRVKAENCVYIGDALSDIQAGKNANMATIACQFGYLNPNTPIATWGADFLAETARDILPLVCN